MGSTGVRPRIADGAPRRRSIGWVEHACVMLVVALLFGQLVAFGANTALLSAIAALADVIVALALLLLLRPPDALWVGLSPVLLLLALALCWAGLPEVAAPLFASPPPRPVPELFPLEWAKLLGGFACLLSGAALGSRTLVTRRLVDWLLAAGFVWALLALTLRQIDPWHVWGYSKGSLGSRFTATLLNTNAAGCAFGVIAVIATGRFQVAIGHTQSRGWSERLAAVVAACATVVAVTLAACALTQSRASLTLTVLMIVVVLIRQVWRSWGALGNASRAAMLGLMALGFALILAMPVHERFELFGRDAQDRLSAMTHFGAIAARSPWFGYGLGSFDTVNANHLTPANVGLLWNFGAAHSSPIHAALEAGIPFVALIFLAIAVAMWRIDSVRRSYVADPLMSAQFAAVALVFLCSLVDIELSVPALLALTAVVAGVVLGRAERAIGSRRSATD